MSRRDTTKSSVITNKNYLLDKMTLSTYDQIKPTIRQVYILPTLHGLYYLILLVVIFIWSVNTQLNFGYAFLFIAFIGLIYFSFLATKNLSNIHFQIKENPELFAGDNLFFIIELNARDNKFNLTLAKDKQQAKPIKELIANKHIKIKVPLMISKRGYHNLGRIRCSSLYPLGLFKVWCYLRFEKEILVYPKPYGNKALPMKEHNQTPQNKQLTDGEEEFFSIRGYQKGDSIKKIIWQKSNYNELYTKIFKQTSHHYNQEYYFSYNDPSIKGLNKEERLSQLCAWVLEANHQKLKYELILPTKKVPLGYGEKQKHLCLKELACY